MNFSAAESTVQNTEQSRSGALFAAYRVGLVTALALVLISCATQTKHVTQPVRPTQPAGTRAALPAPNSTIRAIKAQAFEQDKILVKRKLARNSRNTLESGEVGYYLDVLQGRLKQISGADILVGRGFDRIVLDLSRRVNFAGSAAGIDPGACKELAQLSKVLLEYAKALIAVRVTADSDSSSALGMALARARSVAGCFTAAGVSATRIVAVAVPITPAKDSSAPGAHTHVELQIEPIVRRH